jgi:putative cardiolipin synthase
MIGAARESVLIMSPYFIPGHDGMRVVRELGATDSNGRVTLLTNSLGATDEPLAYAAYARYRLDLLKAGVRIYELSPTLARATRAVSATSAVPPGACTARPWRSTGAGLSSAR